MCYNQNTRLLSKKNPEIVKDVDRVVVDKTMYELMDTKKINKPTLKINYKEQSTYLHSRYNPQREAENIAIENYLPEIENYIIFGLGFGYHVEELMKLSRHANFYIIETNITVFKKALEHVDLKNIITSDRVKLYLTDDFVDINKILKELSSLQHMTIVAHHTFLKIMPESLVQIKYLLEELKMQENSTKIFSLFMEDNFKYNIKNHNNNVDVLFEKFKNMPLFIVAAGPSLDENIQELAKV